jgi:TRAP-type C4-dicarboxylate transport system substrate-binding protein
MQSGVYEGYISASPWWTAFKLNEVAPHFTKTDFGAQYLNAVTINKQAWDRLPADVQLILKELGTEWSAETAKVCASNDEAGLTKLRDLGVEVKEISPATKIEWANALSAFPQSMADELSKRGVANGAAIMNFYMEQIEERGHVWPNRYTIK